MTKHHTFTPGMPHAPKHTRICTSDSETARTTPKHYEHLMPSRPADSPRRSSTNLILTNQNPHPVYNKNHSWLDVGAAGGAALSAAVGGGTDDGAVAAAGAGGGSSATGFAGRSIPIVSTIFCIACAAITC